MLILVKILLAVLSFVLLIIIGVILYGLPATFTLKSGLRPGLKRLSIDEAVWNLINSKKEGWELIEEVRQLIKARMQYCRRNSFDFYEKAFLRGYGYCQQQAFAFSYILNKLGFETRVVYATKNQFPDGNIGGHAWVQIFYHGVTKYLDPAFMESAGEEISFKPLTAVREYTPFFRYFAGWGSIAVNAHRCYKTGRDH